jgi:hypothetical protein
VSFTAATD